MTPSQGLLRTWCVVASALAQVAATAAGMLPWWGLPVTLGLTALVSRSSGPINPRRVRINRALGVASVALLAGVIAVKTVGQQSAGADPVATLRSLTEALVALSLVIAPSARTPREYRVWLTVTTGVLVAAAAGGHSVISAALSMSSWVLLLVAILRVQAAAAAIEGAAVAVPVDAMSNLTYGRRVGQLGTLIPVGATLIAGALVYFALPAGLGGGGLANQIARHVKGNSPSDYATRGEAGLDTYGSGVLDLDLRGSLPTTPVLDVPASSPALWRGTLYTTYTGTDWEAPAEPAFTIEHGNNVALPASPFDPTPQAGHVATYRATPARGFQGSLIWAPGVLSRVVGVHDSVAGVVRRSVNSRLFVAHPPVSYRVTSAIATRSPHRLKSAAGSDPTDPQWTQLPSTLPSEVVALARQVTSSATDRYQQVRDVETYLRTHETYTLNSPVPSPGDDAVDDFLFRDHTGFCEQFASAEAVMLRALGVPTRLVTGLAYGQRFGNERLYTAADAHAWVEVYYPGVGWSPSDPTAGAQLAPSGPTHEGWLARAMGQLSKNLPGGRVALAVITIVLAIGGLVLLRRLRRTHTRSGAKGGVLGPILTAFHRMTRHANSPAPRAPAETAREYIGRVDPAGTLAPALAALEQECYGTTPPSLADSDAAVRSLSDVVRG